MLLSVNLCCICNQVYQLVGITPFVVIPRNKLHKVVVQGNSCICIENAGSWVMDEVCGNHSIFCVSKDTLQFIFRSFLYSSFDFFICCWLLKSAGQVYYGNVDGRNSEGHTCQLTIQFRDNLTYCLSSTSRGWDDISSSCSSASPVFLGRSINGLLSSCCSMYCCHKSFYDSKLVVDYLSKRS